MVNAVSNWLRENGYPVIAGQEQLHGGVTSHVLRLRFADGRSLIYKESVNAKPGMYLAEADGLRALRHAECPVTPEVYSAGEDHLLIEDLGGQESRDESFWESFGHALGHLHNVTAPRYGYDKPNYLGTMPMVNEWQDNGWTFFCETRLLWFLDKPKALEVLSKEDRQAVGRLVMRICEEVPYQPPSLLHGDLWSGNMLIAHGKNPALIDPAVYYGWPEADLAMLPSMPELTDRFWAAYQEVHPLEEGWRERCDLLAVRDPLCMIAEYGDAYDSYKRFKEWLDRALK